MSLFGTIQNAGNALNAPRSPGVTGNNITNANTPVHPPAGSTVAVANAEYGNLLLGTGTKSSPSCSRWTLSGRAIPLRQFDVASGESGEYLRASKDSWGAWFNDLSTSLSSFFIESTTS
jgi:hypothetical protein